MLPLSFLVIALLPLLTAESGGAERNNRATTSTVRGPSIASLVSSRQQSQQPSQIQPHRLRHQRRQSDSGPSLRDLTSRSGRRNRKGLSFGRGFHMNRLQMLRHVWCQKGRFRQKIKHPNCRKRFITNFFCYGQCSSVYIPQYRSRSNQREQPAFQSCGFCFPKRKRVIRVRLQCPRRSPPYKDKFVTVIDECSCIDIKNLIVFSD